MGESLVVYWIGALLQLIICVVLLRCVWWGVFFLLEKCYGVAVIVSGCSLLLPGYISLTIKTTNLELHLNNIHISLRMFDSSCRHCVRVNISGIHLEYWRAATSNVRGAEKAASRMPSTKLPATSRKLRVSHFKWLCFWGLCRLFHLVEFSVKCLEAWVEDCLSDDITFIWTIQVGGHLGLIVSPLPKRELAVALDVDKAQVRFLLQSDTPCPSAENGLYHLGKVEFSSKLLFFLQPLALEPWERLHSIQINTIPLSLDFLHEDVFLCLFQHISSLSKQTDTPQRAGGGDGEPQLAGTPHVRSSLPEFEIVVEDVTLQYYAQPNNRVLTSNLTRVSAAARFSLSKQTSVTPSLPLCFDATINVQGVSLTDSLRRKSLSLKQLLLHTEKLAGVFSNQLQFCSLHLTLWEEEAVFWTKCTTSNLLRTKTKVLRLSNKHRAYSSLAANMAYRLPFSVVTTVEASDWSVQVRMSPASLQSKGPVLRGVMAACVGHVQWSPLEDLTSSVRACLRVTDSYVHVPGYHPTMDNPSFFHQRVDDPSVLPSLHQHLWGRLASLGRLTLQVEKMVRVSGVLGDGGCPVTSKEDQIGMKFDFDTEPLVLSGEGSCVMLEWAQPTVVMVTNVLEHCRVEYANLFSISPSSSSSSSTTSSLSSGSQRFLKGWSLPSLQLCFHVTDVNLFLYALTPEPPCIMLRLDAASLSAPSSHTSTDSSSSRSALKDHTQHPFLLHMASLKLHGILLDDLHLHETTQPFLCSSMANLPKGMGVAISDTISLIYDHQIQNVEVDVKKVWLSWDPTHHISFFHSGNYLLDDLRMLQGAVTSSSSNSSSSSTSLDSWRDPDTGDEVILLGLKVRHLLEKVPVSFTVSFEAVEGVAQVDKRSRVSVEVQKSEVTVNGGVFMCHALQCGILFDQNRIVSIEKLISRFPQDLIEGEAPGGREQFKGRLSVDDNAVVYIGVGSIELVFLAGYNFSHTFDKVLNIKKFLHTIHSRLEVDPNLTGKLFFLAPDILLDCDDFLFQICDDPFEVKLRANYELLCDEHQQKTVRLQALSQKIGQIKKEHGEYAISGQRVLHLYDALELKDSEIYCQRARNMYESTDISRTSLFQFSMSGTKIRGMFDPVMLGHQRVAAHVRDMDLTCPMPEGYQFSTLWGGYVTGLASTLELQVRDYPYPVIGIEDITISGRIVFAEQEAQEREKRQAVVEVGKPWANVIVQRKLPPLKYFYDFEMTSSVWDMAYGPCLEPGMAQASGSFGLLTAPTVDPSKPLAYWDKLRLLFHGPIHLLTQELRLVLPSTFDPYNSVEYLELKMTSVDLNLLTNTKLSLAGAAQLLLHTASKYDECEIFSFPSASATISLNWCVNGGDPNRHHYVVRCASDKLPSRSDKQEHDSYSSFRSYNLDLEFKVDIHPQCSKEESCPSVVLYSSTLRCLQLYQMLMKWNVTRPTKRGKYFNNVKPRRPPLLRHWRDVKLSLSFPKTLFRYWSSRALQQGVECSLDGAELSLSFFLILVTVDSSLIQRRRANWTVRSFSGCGQGIVAWIKKRTDLTEASAIKEEEDDDYILIDSNDHVTSMLLSVDKLPSYCLLKHQQSFLSIHQSCACFEEFQLVPATIYPGTYTQFLFLARLTYRRQESTEPGSSEYTHKLEATNTRLLWNASNRNVVLDLYYAFKQMQELKRYLSTEALKSILSKKDLADEQKLHVLPKEAEVTGPGHTHISSPRKRQSTSGNTMLDQLLLDINNQYVRYVDESAPSDPQLKGIMAINMKDITNNNWLITLVNTQVVLQGIEQRGYVLASSHMTSVFGCDHEPKMKNGVHISKKSWMGKIQELQYFTTQSAKDELDYVPWLPMSVIRPPGTGRADQNHTKSEAYEEANLNALLGTLGPSDPLGDRPSTPLGEAVGGTVDGVRLDDSTETAATSGVDCTIQLQRVAPRCHCQVIYVTYGDQVEAEITRASSPGNSLCTCCALSGSGDVDTFTFRYPSVEVRTTSYQYALIMDIINNLLLHKQSKKKEVIARHARMKFHLQLSSNVKDPRKAVLNQQNKVKKCLQVLRKAETAFFLEQKYRNPEVLQTLEGNLTAAKEKLSAASLKLSILVNTFRQSQLYLTPTSHSSGGTLPSDPMLRIEVWVDKTHWTLTHSDGQLHLADISFTNFSYNRLTFTDDSGEHRLELGTFEVKNLMPNTPPIYEKVLFPYDPKKKCLRVDKNVTLRVYCKDKAPVAGISVKEHMEVNVVPLTVCLTSRFYHTLQDFFFPKAAKLSDQAGPDHSHLFGPTGVQPPIVYGESTDGSICSISHGGSVLRKSNLPMSSSTSSIIPSNHSPPNSLSAYDKKKLDDVEKMKNRATETKTFIYVKIPQITLCITYKSENVSIKDLQNQRVTVPTLEYHNRNWTWTDMLMEVKRDYRIAIVGQTIKSAIGMKGSSDEVAGLASPKMIRHANAGDLLLGRIPSVQGKLGQSKKIFSRLSSRDGDKSSKSDLKTPSLRLPLTDSEITLKRSARTIQTLTHNADHNENQ